MSRLNTKELNQLGQKSYAYVSETRSDGPIVLRTPDAALHTSSYFIVIHCSPSYI